MLTRTRTNRARALLLGAAAAVVSFGASAMEEVIVYGKEAAVEAENAKLKAELEEYLEALHRRIKEQLDEDLKKRPAARIELTAAESPSRG